MRAANQVAVALGLFIVAVWYDHMRSQEAARVNYRDQMMRQVQVQMGYKTIDGFRNAEPQQDQALLRQEPHDPRTSADAPGKVKQQSTPSTQDRLEQHILAEHALEEAHEGAEKTLEEMHEHLQREAATVELSINSGDPLGYDRTHKQHPQGQHDKQQKGGARQHERTRRGHNWSGYKGPLLESKQLKPNSEFYTKYVHGTIEKKLAYPMLKGFWDKVLKFYPNATNWFDGGAGTCGVMEAVLKAGKQIHGVELSDVSQTTCRDIYRQGLVQQAPLHEIPHRDNSFDLVFSSEVLEHVPPNLAEQSVRELVRIAQRDVFATISLRPSALDRPGKPPKVHLCVRPRVWWEALFEKAGCLRNEEAYKLFQQYDKGKPVSPHFFIYTCDKSHAD